MEKMRTEDEIKKALEEYEELFTDARDTGTHEDMVKYRAKKDILRWVLGEE
jgi:uncharacterized membrane protein